MGTQTLVGQTHLQIRVKTSRWKFLQSVHEMSWARQVVGAGDGMIYFFNGCTQLLAEATSITRRSSNGNIF